MLLMQLHNRQKAANNFAGISLYTFWNIHKYDTITAETAGNGLKAYCSHHSYCKSISHSAQWDILEIGTLYMTVKLHLVLFHCDFISITMNRIKIQIRKLQFLLRNLFQTFATMHIDDGKDLAVLQWKNSQ